MLSDDYTPDEREGESEKVLKCGEQLVNIIKNEEKGEQDIT